MFARIKQFERGDPCANALDKGDDQMSSKLPSVAEDEAKLEQALLDSLAERLKVPLARLERSNQLALETATKAGTQAAVDEIKRIANDVKAAKSSIAPEQVHGQLTTLNSLANEIKAQVSTHSVALRALEQKALSDVEKASQNRKAVADALQESTQLTQIASGMKALEAFTRAAPDSKTATSLQTITNKLDVVLQHIQHIGNQSSRPDIPSVAAGEAGPGSLAGNVESNKQAWPQFVHDLGEKRVQTLNSIQEADRLEIQSLLRKLLQPTSVGGEAHPDFEALDRALTKLSSNEKANGNNEIHSALEDLRQRLRTQWEPNGRTKNISWLTYLGIVVASAAAIVSFAKFWSPPQTSTKSAESGTAVATAPSSVANQGQKSAAKCVHNEELLGLLSDDGQPSALLVLLELDLGHSPLKGEMSSALGDKLANLPSNSALSACRSAMKEPRTPLFGTVTADQKREILNTCFPPKSVSDGTKCASNDALVELFASAPDRGRSALAIVLQRWSGLKADGKWGGKSLEALKGAVTKDAERQRSLTKCLAPLDKSAKVAIGDIDYLLTAKDNQNAVASDLNTFRLVRKIMDECFPASVKTNNPEAAAKS